MADDCVEDDLLLQQADLDVGVEQATAGLLDLLVYLKRDNRRFDREIVERTIEFLQHLPLNIKLKSSALAPVLELKTCRYFFWVVKLGGAFVCDSVCSHSSPPPAR